ncbi:MAG: hypothetical protein J6Q48_06060 [Bacteroidaceae bacterium]|nr:hypothetical protein [Bacteroidaceae bacterium]
MYKSPIEVIYGEMQMKVENDIYKAVQNVGVNVDKEELLKALEHDRGQYDKGYADAVTEILGVIREVYHNFSGYDLEYMTKYGNETAEQQHQSYSSLMMYEIAMEFDDLIDRLENMKGGAE